MTLLPKITTVLQKIDCHYENLYCFQVRSLKKRLSGLTNIIQKDERQSTLKSKYHQNVKNE